MFKSVISVILVGCLLWQAAYAATSPEAEASRSSGAKTAAEFLGGVGGGAVAFILGAVILLPVVEGMDEEDVGARFAVGVLFGSACATGSAAGTFVVGKALKDDGSFKAAFFGGLTPSLAGALLGLSGEGSLEPFHDPFFGAYLGSLTAPLGATIGHAVSRRPRRSESQSQSPAISPAEGCLLGGIVGCGAGGLVGVPVGYLIASSIADPSEHLYGAIIGFIFGVPLGGILGATIGYVRSWRSKKPESQSLLHIEDSKIRVGILSPMLMPIVLSRGESTWQYHVDLVSVRF